jgi:hypothetical protein
MQDDLRILLDPDVIMEWPDVDEVSAVGYRVAHHCPAVHEFTVNSPDSHASSLQRSQNGVPQ